MAGRPKVNIPGGTLYVRLKDEKNLDYIHKVVDKSHYPTSEVVEAMIAACRTKQLFSMPVRECTKCGQEHV